MVIKGEDFKNLCIARSKTANNLIVAEDWGVAIYIMGYAMEAALKSVICKTLGIEEYPHEHTDNDGKADDVARFFRTHNLVQLLLVSGMQEIFKSRKAVDAEAFAWDQFIKEYPADWTAILRYSPEQIREENKPALKNKAKKLYNHLEAILGIIDKYKKW